MLRAWWILVCLLVPCSIAEAQKNKKKLGERWTEARAMAWQKQQPWLVGCNFIPSTAINQIQMWQVFDGEAIERKLGWAKALGFNTVRVFLHDLVWKDNPDRFADRIDGFLRIAAENDIRVMFVLFDSCWHPEPKLGKQPEPKPHVHNSGWVQSPGVAVLQDPAKWKEMEGYVKDVLRRFKNDKRILCWDLWNEPENNNASSYGDRDLKNKEAIVLPLVKQVFAWAREIKPSQPITAAPWAGDWSNPDKLSPLNKFLFESSDIITFHRYENLAATKKAVEALKRYKRPILCTEFMARPAGSTFEAILPYLKEENVGAYCWGFVSGKTQTIYPWDSWKKKYDAEPKVWFHDIYRPNGKPFDEKEIQAIKKLTLAGIEVRLRFSVEEVDPAKPDKSYVECTVRNSGVNEIRVPSIYTGGWESDMILKATGWHELRLVFWAGEKNKEFRQVKPGEEITIFKDELNAVMLLDMTKAKAVMPKEKRYYWSWQA